MPKANGFNQAKEPVSISMPTALTSRLSRYCFKKDLPVSTVVCKAVKRFLAAEMGEDCAFWEAVYDRYGENGSLGKL